MQSRAEFFRVLTCGEPRIQILVGCRSLEVSFSRAGVPGQRLQRGISMSVAVTTPSEQLTFS